MLFRSSPPPPSSPPLSPPLSPAEVPLYGYLELGPEHQEGESYGSKVRHLRLKIKEIEDASVSVSERFQSIIENALYR